MMSYEKLDVYQCSIQFLAQVSILLQSIPRGNSALKDQLSRAATSVPLNIAEGAGKRTNADCRRYFEIARGSAMECGAILDVLFVLKLIGERERQAGKTLLHRIVCMLTKINA